MSRISYTMTTSRKASSCMFQSTQSATSMKLAIGICLTAIGVLLSVADAKPNPEAKAKPLTVKAHVGVNVNSRGSQSAKGACPPYGGPCLKEGAIGCRGCVHKPCCEGLHCEPALHQYGMCSSIKLEQEEMTIFD